MYMIICVHVTSLFRYAVDLVVCVALGCDMFDCVFPTRTAVIFFVIFFRSLNSLVGCGLITCPVAAVAVICF